MRCALISNPDCSLKRIAELDLKLQEAVEEGLAVLQGTIKERHEAEAMVALHTSTIANLSKEKDGLEKENVVFKCMVEKLQDELLDSENKKSDFEKRIERQNNVIQS